MKLRKRYVRNIRENTSFYVASIILTIVTLFLFFMFDTAGNAIIAFGDEFFARNKLEDAHFTTYLPMTDEEIEELEEKYHVTLETQQYINLENKKVTAKVFERTTKVDLYEVTEGKDIAADDEIVISEGYAVKNKVKIGDQMEVGTKTYKVVGFMQRPDYLYMLENEDDSYKNISTFYLCYMSDHAFEELQAEGVQYLVRYGKESDASGFRKEVHDTYYMRSYSAAADNARITMVDEQAQMFIAMAYVLLVVLPLVAVILISIIISRKVKSEQRMIGTLSALGYTKRQLMWHYAGFAALPGIVGGILTVIASALTAQPLGELGLQDYEPMRIHAHLDPVAAVLGILVPTVMYVLAALLSVRRLLKKNTVLLLNGNADGDKRHFRRVFANKKMSFRKKFAVRSMLGNPGRSLVVLIGVFLGCFIMLLGLGFFDSINHMGNEAVAEMGSYKHQYVLNELLEENPYGGETILVAAEETKDGNGVSVIGADAEGTHLNLEEKDGGTADIEDGYYITRLAELAYGWHTGDMITLYNPRSLEKTKIKVKGVIQNNVQKAVISSKQLAADLTGLEADKFNCILSDEKLNIPETKIAQELENQDVIDQVRTMIDQMGFLLVMIVILGVIICIAAVYVAVNMLVTESRSSISMLKVLGYNDRQIDKIVLSSHHILLPLGILLSIPAVYASMHAFFLMIVDYGVLMLKAHIGLASYAISIGLTAACYFVSLWFLRRKVKRVDMIESLKDNRE